MKCLLLNLSVLLISGLFINLQAQPLSAGTGNQSVVDSSQLIADQIIKSKVPVLVDFWAPWCAPCRMLNPIIKDLEKEFAGKVLFMKVNVDIHRSIAAYFGVNSIPAVFIVNNKIVVESIPGLQPKEVYADALKEILAGPVLTEPSPTQKNDK